MHVTTTTTTIPTPVQVPYFPPLQSPEDFGPETCVDLVRKAAGRSDLQLTVSERGGGEGAAG